jgi:hypothetical protein
VSQADIRTRFLSFFIGTFSEVRQQYSVVGGTWDLRLKKTRSPLWPETDHSELRVRGVLSVQVQALTGE